MKRVLRTDGKRGLFSRGLYLSIVLAAAAGILGMGEMLEYIAGAILPAGEIRCISALYLALGSEWLSYILPVACTMAMSGAYIEDLQSGVLPYMILRTTKKRYYVSKMLSCAIFGMLTVLMSVLLMLIVLGFLFPPERLELQGFQIESFVYVGKRTLILCINGSFYALAGGGISAALQNRYMAYAAPFILYYVLSTLFEAYMPGHPLINPKEWMLLRVSGEWVVTGILLAVNAAAAVAYLLVMERRWKDE